MKPASDNILKVALCQHDIVWEDAAATIGRIDRPVRRFCERYRPDLLVFPETFNVGFTMNPDVAEENDGPSSAWLRGIAASCGTAVIASVPVKLHGPGGEECRVNRCRFIAPDGTEYIYDKHHLFTPSGEFPAYTPGNSRCTVPYKGWNIELNVCYDLRFPVWSRNEGCRYDLLVNIANWPASRIEAADILLRARAVENACYALFCNRVGEDALCGYDGHSMVLDFFGGDIARRRRAGGVRFYQAGLSLKKLRHYRERFPVSADADKYEIIL
ncbi:MAG: nitrilase family protein [Bacteroidales bacterium]|nr:nitrilase family protein [Bacteroidales bacterium]